MNFIARLYPFLVMSATVLVVLSCGSNDAAPSVQEQQLNLLSRTWTIKTATHDTGRTADFQNPDLTITFSGAYKSTHPKGPYTYTVAGKLPVPSPWAEGAATWMFGDDATNTIIRDDNVSIHYVQEGDTLTLNFTCATCNDDNARTGSVEGDWVFVFAAVK